jgi:hypothetical protein
MPIIKKHQTTLDFVTQYSGALDGLFTMALLNGISITSEPAPGTNLQVEVVDLKTVKYYATSGLDVQSNGITNVRPGGIGYMQIGNDFKVS